MRAFIFENFIVWLLLLLYPLVVQRIGHEFAELKIQVRFLARGYIKKRLASSASRFFIYPLEQSACALFASRNRKV